MGEASRSSRYGRLFSSGWILFFGLAANLGLGFLTRVLMARILGRVDYGAVALGYTLLTVGAMVAVLGTDTGVGRYLPRFDAEKRRRGVLASAFHVVVPLSVVLGALLVVIAEPLAIRFFGDPDLAPMIRVFAVGVPLATFVKLTIGSVRGMEDTLPRVTIRNVGFPLARLVLVVVVLIVGVQAIAAPVAIAWAYVGAYLVAAALAAHYLVRHTPLFDGEETVHMHGELLVFSAPLVVTVTMAMVFHKFDTILLGYFASTGTVGVYNVVYPLARLLTAVLTSFGFLFMPMLSGLEADGKFGEMSRLYQVVSKWIFLATLPLFLAMVSAPRTIIQLTFGREYVAGGLALAVLAVGFFTHAVAGPGGNALIAIGRSRTIMIDNTVVALVNIALNVVLIPVYGVVGAAVATTVGFGLMNGLYLVQLHRVTGIHPFTTALVRPGLVAAGLWTTTWLAASMLVPGVSALIVAGLGFGALYPVVILRYGGVQSEDIALVETAADRLDVDIDPIRGVAARVIN